MFGEYGVRKTGGQENGVRLEKRTLDGIVERG